MTVTTHPPPESDRVLVQSCLQGDTHAFGQLYDRYQGQVRNTLYQLCGDDRLDDLVQDVFVRAWKGLRRFRHSSKFSTWLYRITWNVASDRRKELARQRSRQQALIGAAANTPRPTPLNDLHYREIVRRALATLSLDRRTVLVLHDLEDLPQREIAEIVGIPVGTVKSRLFHARAAVKRFLQAEGIDV